MSTSELSSQLIEDWQADIQALEQQSEDIEESQDGVYQASWDAAFERSEPTLKRNVIQHCLEDIEAADSISDLLRALAHWQDEADERDKRILDRVKSFRSFNQRFQFESCISNLEAVIPNTELEDCYQCDGKKWPVKDRRYSEGYRWECSDCYKRSMGQSTNSVTSYYVGMWKARTLRSNTRS